MQNFNVMFLVLGERTSYANHFLGEYLIGARIQFIIPPPSRISTGAQFRDIMAQKLEKPLCDCIPMSRIPAENVTGGAKKVVGIQ